MSQVHPRGAAMAALVIALLVGCRGTPPSAQVSEATITRLVDSLTPAVERAVGLPFKMPPRSALVSRDEVRAYLLAKVAEEFPAERLEGMETAYRLLGLLPDTLDLKRLLLDLYAEQVAGYYDPETELLYAVRGADRTQLRLIMAHELVHALQHQYLPLDSLMTQRGDGDRLAATQAVLEGHATLASVRVLAPDPGLLDSDAFWETYREQVRNQQQSMPVFSQAPLVLRESLIFPYMGGAAFMRWWQANRSAPLPTLAELPTSTEQVLHPTRYAAGDRPIAVRFPDTRDGVLYEDTLGELEIHILLAELRGSQEAALFRMVGWAGDRYRVYRTAAGPALEWLTVWENPARAERFRIDIGQRFRPKAGYRRALTEETVGNLPAVRLTHGPVPPA